MLMECLNDAITGSRAISGNPMRDGYIIGLVYANSGIISQLITTESQIPPLSDNVIQQVALCIAWLTENEDTISQIYIDFRDSPSN
jgi:hypothetical protein